MGWNLCTHPSTPYSTNAQNKRTYHDGVPEARHGPISAHVVGVVEVVDLRAVEQGQAAEGAPGEGVPGVRRARLPDAQGDPPEVHQEV